MSDVLLRRGAMPRANVLPVGNLIAATWIAVLESRYTRLSRGQVTSGAHSAQADSYKRARCNAPQRNYILYYTEEYLGW